MNEKSLWEFLEKHLNAIYSGDFKPMKKQHTKTSLYMNGL